MGKQEIKEKLKKNHENSERDEKVMEVVIAAVIKELCQKRIAGVTTILYVVHIFHFIYI